MKPCQVKNNLLLSMASLIAFLFHSCSKPPCRCDFDPVHSLETKIVNTQGQNLFLGPAAIYKIDSIRVLNSSNDLSINNASVRKGLSDTTALRFDFYVQATKSFIYYNQQTKPDSLEVDWVQKTGRCCNNPQTYYTIDKVRFNGQIIQPQNGIYLFVK